LAIVPYPLKMEAKGQLLPKKRGWVFAPVPGHVVDFRSGLKSGSPVNKDQDLILLHSMELGKQVREIKDQMAEARRMSEFYGGLIQNHPLENQTAEWKKEKIKADAVFDAKTKELTKLRLRTNAALQN